ncbi:MAG: hypothetical protein WCV85_02250 [Patescibacteria group bacterium]|jgi:hypothetical protein
MSLVLIAQFFIAATVSFLLCKIFLGKYEGDKIGRSIRPKLGKYRVHIHHWIWLSVALIILLVVNVHHPVLLGLIVGSIIQGLLYRDRFIIVYQDKDFEKIYSKYRKIPS